MSERHKQTTFLKRLLEKEDSEERWRLQEEILKAEQNERCVRSAMSGVGVIALLSVCGLCYEAIFQGDFFQNPGYFLTRLFGYLGLGSVICWVAFLGCWFWYRALANRLYEDCRRLLAALSETRIPFHPPQECLATGNGSVPKQDRATMTPPGALPMSEAA